ncbi:hypothetical protein METY_0062 [Methylopila sp. Yamaguchi]|nr:hypothetical protein METY_0062 [Methylopila sp. Yamaguchi]
MEGLERVHLDDHGLADDRDKPRVHALLGGNLVPVGRSGSAEEIVATVAFLVSDGAAYITGQNIRMDGGLTRSI